MKPGTCVICCRCGSTGDHNYGRIRLPVKYVTDTVVVFQTGTDMVLYISKEFLKLYENAKLPKKSTPLVKIVNVMIITVKNARGPKVENLPFPK